MKYPLPLILLAALSGHALTAVAQNTVVPSLTAADAQPAAAAASAPSVVPQTGLTPGAAVAPMPAPLQPAGGRSVYRPPAVKSPFIPQTARNAANQSAVWANNPRAEAVMDRDGKLVYTYGESRPTVVCQPLRVCSVELEPGETVNNVDIGDAVRWSLKPSIAGSGDQRTVIVVIKPKDYNLDTNVMIATDRRSYYLRLVSSREGANISTTRVGFYYPENERKAWEAQRAALAVANKNVVAELPSLTVDNLNFSYQIEGPKEHFTPIRAFDDGAKVYIQMPAAFQHREAPALVLVGTDGKEELVNYRLKDDYYIVDKLFSKAALILGVGSEQRRVTITAGTCTSRGLFGTCQR